MAPKWAQDLSKLNNAELLKIEKDGLDAAADIVRYAALGFEAIPQGDIDRFKWMGLYVQRPKKAGYFMLRVKLPGGLLNSAQARALAGISAEYGRNLLDITTRQSIQFHWLRIENLPDIFTRLAGAGLSTVEAAGDCPRNVVGHPLAGIDPEEIIDVTAIIQDLNRYFENNREYSNLPRKFKIAVSGSPYNTGHAEINDLAFMPAVKEIDGTEKLGFHVMAGGGLSATPHMARQLNLFVLPEEVVAVAAGAAALFRDYGYREKRHHARLKFLIADWGVDKFQNQLQEIAGPLRPEGRSLISGWNAGFYYGVHRQKQAGLNYVGLFVPAGRLSADDLYRLGQLAEQYGDGSLRTTYSQNILITNVPDANTDKLLAEELLQKLTPFPQGFAAHTVTCTGKEFCPLGVVETKQRIMSITQCLDSSLEVDIPVRIHISGCLSSCGQPQIADIGLQGAVMGEGDKVVEAFEVWVGGALGPNGGFGAKLKGRIPADSAARILSELIVFYKNNRMGYESFHEFFRRIGIQAFQEKFDTLL